MDELEKLKQLFEDDLQSLIELTFVHGPVRDRHVRQASVIVRRWLCDNELRKLGKLLGQKVTFPAQDDEHIFKVIKSDPDIDYCLSAGVKFKGKPLALLYSSRSPIPPTWIGQLHQIKTVDVRLGKALGRPSLYFEDEIFNLGDVLRFACNKLGGAHFDSNRTAREEKLERASRFVTFGPPANTVPSGRVGSIHVPLEDAGADVLSGISVSVIVAASMLVNVRFDGQNLLDPDDLRKRLLKA